MRGTSAALRSGKKERRNSGPRIPPLPELLAPNQIIVLTDRRHEPHLEQLRIVVRITDRAVGNEEHVVLAAHIEKAKQFERLTTDARHIGDEDGTNFVTLDFNQNPLIPRTVVGGASAEPQVF